MVSMKALMSLSQYDMGVLDGIAKVKNMLADNNSCNGKVARLIEQYHSDTQAEMVGIKTENVEEFEQLELGDLDDQSRCTTGRNRVQGAVFLRNEQPTAYLLRTHDSYFSSCFPCWKQVHFNGYSGVHHHCTRSSDCGGRISEIQRYGV